MYSATEIQNIALKGKNKLLRYHYGKSSKTAESLGQFKKHELNALLLLTIETPVELCRFLKTEIQKFENIINKPFYNHYQVVKKRGGTREIFAPAKELKAIQKRLNYFLQAYYLTIKPEEVHGFVINPGYLGKHCNIVANAKAHTGKKYVLNIDLKDFFPGISARQVKDVFMSELFKFEEQIANAMTLLTTYEGRLPTGAPSSPVISNFICHKLDKDLIEFAAINSISYTRYADDLTFSSNTPIPSDSILDIINLIRKNNFRINEKKLRLRSSNCRQTVTGITVNEKVNVNRILLKKIRAMLHDLKTNGVETATRKHFKINAETDPGIEQFFIRRLRGYINFVGQVRGMNDELYLRLMQTFKS